MKQVLFILAFTVFIFTSCKKSDTTTPATTNVIIETESGVTSTHTYASAIYGVSSYSGNYVMNITSLDPAGKETIELIISSPVSLVVNTPYIPLNIFYGPYTFDNAPVKVGTVTITSLTATHVKGTFSGDVYRYSTGVTKHLTNGSFDAEITP